MGDFSYGRAIGAGFRLIGRRPLAVLIWAAVYLVLVVAPAVAMLALVLPRMLAAVRDIGAHNGPLTAPQLVALQSGAFGWQPAIWLLSIVTNTVVIGAIFRAVLEPENGAWGYLRLGRQELWLGLIYLVITVMGVIMALVLLFPISIGAGVLAAIAERGGVSGGGIALLCMLGFAGFAAIVWVLLRLSLALPLSFAQGRFLLYESWDLTRGHAVKMFLVFLALGVGLLLAEVAFGVSVGVGVLSHAVSLTSWETITPDSFNAAVRRFGPAIAAAAVAATVISMAVHAILLAPLAQIYRELTEEPAAA
jgi:hypothetical protein